MNVQIIEKKNDKSVGVYPITLGDSMGQSESDYFDEAWRCAIKDRLVDPSERTA